VLSNYCKLLGRKFWPAISMVLCRMFCLLTIWACLLEWVNSNTVNSLVYRYYTSEVQTEYADVMTTASMFASAWVAVWRVILVHLLWVHCSTTIFQPCRSPGKYTSYISPCNWSSISSVSPLKAWKALYHWICLFTYQQLIEVLGWIRCLIGSLCYYYEMHASVHAWKY